MSDRGFQGSTGSNFARLQRAFLQNVAASNRSSASSTSPSSSSTAHCPSQESQDFQDEQEAREAQVSAAYNDCIKRQVEIENYFKLLYPATSTSTSTPPAPSTSSPTTSLSATEQIEPAKHAKHDDDESDLLI